MRDKAWKEQKKKKKNWEEVKAFQGLRGQKPAGLFKLPNGIHNPCLLISERIASPQHPS